MKRLVIIALAVFASSVTGASAAATDPGKLQSGTYPGGYSYLRYVPKSLKTTSGAPLFVMVHGCNTTAEQQMKANQLNRLAEQEKFVVLYPDADPSTRLLRCWRFTEAGGFPANDTRGSADPAAIVGMTRKAAQDLKLDLARLYLAGMSSGAAMAGIVAATYPEVFAAVAMNAGCAYRAGRCVATIPGESTDALGRAAYKAMGRRARVIPVLVMQGDKDALIPPAHAPQVVKQWSVTNALAAPRSGLGRLGLSRATTKTITTPGRYTSSVESYRDRGGCLIVERWTIKGMDHFWPGGSRDPESAPFTDPKAPDGGRIAWRFFSQYRLAKTGEPCVAAQ